MRWCLHSPLAVWTRWDAIPDWFVGPGGLLPIAGLVRKGVVPGVAPWRSAPDRTLLAGFDVNQTINASIGIVKPPLEKLFDLPKR